MDANYLLQLKPFERKEGVKYKIIQITDVQLHTNKMGITTSVGDKIKKAFELKRPGRIYDSIKKIDNKDDNLKIIIELLKGDLSFLKFVQDEEKMGYKILLGLPEDGIPVLLGKDTEEFIDSKKGRRFLRWFGKNR